MNTVDTFANQEYKEGWVTDIEMDTAPPGLTEEIIRFISAKKNEPDFLLKWRLKAYEHWLTMKEPKWQFMEYSPIDFQDIIYYAAPKKTPKYASLDEVDPELLETYSKLGIRSKSRKCSLGSL